MCLDPISRRRLLQLTAASTVLTAAGEIGRPSAAEAQGQAPPRPEVQMTAGMIDFHVHTFPDNFDRTVSAVEAARGARERGLKAIVLKGGALALCAKHDLVLETCHLAPQEALILIREARGAGVQKIVCTHADYDPINMSIDEQREAARLGAFIEHAYIGVFLGPQSSVPRFQPWRGATVEQMAAAIKTVGAQSSILASDMGAAPLDPPINGFVAFVKRLGELGITDAQLDQMTRANPLALLGM